MVFTDAQQAFYSVLRELCFSLGTSDEQLASLFQTLGLPAGALQLLAKVLESPTAFEAAMVPKHLECVLTDFFRGTWFSVQHSPQLWCPRKGTKPGDPLADIIFAFVMAQILTRIHDEVQSLGVVCSAPYGIDRSLAKASTSSQRIEIPNVTFVGIAFLCVS